MAWANKHHRRVEIELLKKLLNRNPIRVANPHKQSLKNLSSSGLVVISGAFAVLARKKDLEKVYSNDKSAENSKSSKTKCDQVNPSARKKKVPVKRDPED